MLAARGDVGIIIFEDVENHETFTLLIDLTKFKESVLYVLCKECYTYNNSLYIKDIDSNFELATKEDYDRERERERESISEAIEEVLRHYDRERESISEAIEEVLRHYDKNRQND